jgi:hypothetical protein
LHLVFLRVYLLKHPDSSISEEQSSFETAGILMWSLSNSDLQNGASQDPFEVKFLDSASLSFIARTRYNYHGLELFRGSAGDVKIMNSQKELIDVQFLNGTESMVRSPLFCPQGKRAYFEVTFESVGDNPKIGFCSEHCEPLLGQYFELSAVYGDFWATSVEHVYFEDRQEPAHEDTSKWQKGSVIGIMCDLLHGTVLAFHNGTYKHLFLTESLRNVERLYPALICDCSHMLVNFGQKPFSYPHLSFLPMQSFVGYCFDKSTVKKSGTSAVYNKWDKIDARDSNRTWLKAVVVNNDSVKGVTVHFIGYDKAEIIRPEDVDFCIRARRSYTPSGDKRESLREVKLLYEVGHEQLDIHGIEGGIQIPVDSRSNVSGTENCSDADCRTEQCSDSDDTDDDIYEDVVNGAVFDDYVADHHDSDDDDDARIAPCLFPVLHRLHIVTSGATQSHNDDDDDAQSHIDDDDDAQSHIEDDPNPKIQEYKRPGVVLCWENHNCGPNIYEDDGRLCDICSTLIEGPGFCCSYCEFDVCLKCAKKRRKKFQGRLKNPVDGQHYQCRLTVFEDDWHCCDLCRGDIIKGSQGMQCSDFDFDVCHNCTSMPARVSFEEFSTVRSDRAFMREDRVGYFEIQIDSIVLLQLGFVTDQFKKSPESDTREIGVGDEENGWGWDGSRSCFWNCGEREEILDFEWSDGDVLGFLCDFDRNITSLFQNGELKHSKIFSDDISALYPAFTGHYSVIRVYWRNGFGVPIPKEVMYRSCITCDKRHVCQPCVYQEETNCSLCHNPIACNTYGIHCQPCGFFCCSNCDVQSSVYCMNAEKDFFHKFAKLPSSVRDFHMALNIKSEWEKLEMGEKVALVNVWMKDSSLLCENCEKQTCYPHFFEQQRSYGSPICQRCQHPISREAAEMGSKCDDDECTFKLCHDCTFAVPILECLSQPRWLYSIFLEENSDDGALSGYVDHYHQPFKDGIEPFDLDSDLELKEFKKREHNRVNVVGKVVNEKNACILSFSECGSNNDKYLLTVPSSVNLSSAHWIKGAIIPSTGILGFPRKTCEFNHVCEVYACNVDDTAIQRLCSECNLYIQPSERGLWCSSCHYFLCFECSSLAEPLEGVDNCKIEQCFWNSSEILVAGLSLFSENSSVCNSIRIWNVNEGIATICQSTNTDEKRLVDMKTDFTLSKLNNSVVPWKFSGDGAPKISAESSTSNICVQFSQFSTVRSEHPFNKKESDMGFYEIYISKIGPCPQIGFCLEQFEKDSINNGTGAGDDDLSWGFDGKRNRLWCNGEARQAGSLKWKDGDVIGLLCDFLNLQMTAFTNGEPSAHVIPIPKDVVQLFPCVTGRDMHVRSESPACWLSLSMFSFCMRSSFH